MQNTNASTIARLYDDYDSSESLAERKSKLNEDVGENEKLLLKEGLAKVLREAAMEIEGDYYVVTSKSDLKKYVLGKLEQELGLHKNVLRLHFRKLLKSYMPELIFCVSLMLGWFIYSRL